MMRLPVPALALGWLGLVPFLAGAAMLFLPPDSVPTFGLFASSPEGGVTILERFGAIILGFMGGCLWGFACARPGGPTPTLLLASIVPAFLAFVAMRDNPALSCLWLAFGFVALQAIDVWFQRVGVAPVWWLSLRLPLTAGVIACLLTGALYG